jgi:Ca-activated chloride channel family protein
MTRRSVFSFLFLAIIAVIGISFSSRSQTKKQTNSEPPQDVDVIRVSTTLVTVPVSVMDRNGRFIPDLKQDQFRLFEDGVEQQIAFFENAEQPFTVALLLDVSDSTAAKLTQIKDAAAAFVNELRADDRVLIMTFDKRITILCEATSDRRLLESAISRAQSGGGTSLYDAIDSIITKRLKQIRGRKAIVLFTDGVDTTSRGASYESTLRTAEELDALIYAIQFNTYADVSKAQGDASIDPAQMSSGVVTSKGEPLNVAYKRAERFLQLLPDKTGGRFYYAASLGHLKEVFARIAAELREQYSLGYYPSNKSATKSKRELKVKVSVPNVAIRSRRSYIYTAPAQ